MLSRLWGIFRPRKSAFNTHRAVSTDGLGTLFVLEVPPLGGELLMENGGLLRRLCPPLRADLAPRHCALRPPELTPALAEVRGGGDWLGLSDR